MKQQDGYTSRFLSVACMAEVFLYEAARHQRRDDAAEITIRDKVYTLRPASESTPVDLAGVELVGCSDAEKRSIAQCLGRIPTKLPVWRVEVAWAEHPMAARVSVRPDACIYLREGEDGTWTIRDVVLSNPLARKRYSSPDRTPADSGWDVRFEFGAQWSADARFPTKTQG